MNSSAGGLSWSFEYSLSTCATKSAAALRSRWNSLFSSEYQGPSAPRKTTPLPEIQKHLSRAACLPPFCGRRIFFKHETNITNARPHVGELPGLPSCFKVQRRPKIPSDLRRFLQRPPRDVLQLLKRVREEAPRGTGRRGLRQPDRTACR